MVTRYFAAAAQPLVTLRRRGLTLACCARPCATRRDRQ